MIVLPVVFISLLALVGGAYVTNPFSRFTIIKRPFTVQMVMGTLQAINHNHKLQVRQQWYWKLFATLKMTIHILETRYVRSPRSNADSLNGIIADIHRQRFNPDKLLLTSGDHFSALFVRNLGVFYYPMLDARIQSDEQDWHNRQTSYLQTVAYALGVFEKYPVPVPTIVPTGAYSATCVKFWSYPSDTVYGILYALAALSGKEAAAPVDYGKKQQRANTTMAAKVLMNEYHDTLVVLYADYRETVFDPETNLIKQGLHLSGAKDITRRKCAFYDNVIFWKTTELAMKLGVIENDKHFLSTVKKHIIEAFWLEEEGYFLEDLSDDGKAGKYYSSDWLIVLITGFLSPANKDEQHYFTKSIAYIQAKGIDKPFAIKYQHEARGQRSYFWPRIAFASYGGDVIWSFWGMEYIKTLILLYKATGEQQYKEAARKHLRAYEKTMRRDGGFPETMSRTGELYETLLYRSIRLTGWVIGFEQARNMYEAYAESV